jgi:hypothetical protein
MISKDEVDHKANNEIIITIKCIRGKQASELAFQRHQSELILKSGYLQLGNKILLNKQWNNRWFELTSKALVHSCDKTSRGKTRLSFVNVTSVKLNLSDATSFLIKMNNGHLYVMCASSHEGCNNNWIWIQIISKTANPIVATKGAPRQANHTPITDSSMDDSVECVFNCTDMNLP